MNPFRGNWCNYVYNTRIMGHEIDYETRAYFLRTTPLWLREYRSKEDLKNLFNIEVQPGKHVRDFVRHLCVYLHCVSSEMEMKSLAPNMLPTWLSAEEKIMSTESRIYESYRSYLEGLRSLPFDEHAIKPEICIHHPLLPLSGTQHLRKLSNTNSTSSKPLSPYKFMSKRLAQISTCAMRDSSKEVTSHRISTWTLTHREKYELLIKGNCTTDSQISRFGRRIKGTRWYVLSARKSFGEGGAIHYIHFS
jgi:hypothetical protein